jgi:hypothetical protein
VRTSGSSPDQSQDSSEGRRRPTSEMRYIVELQGNGISHDLALAGQKQVPENRCSILSVAFTREQARVAVIRSRREPLDDTNPTTLAPVCYPQLLNLHTYFRSLKKRTQRFLYRSRTTRSAPYARRMDLDSKCTPLGRLRDFVDDRSGPAWRASVSKKAIRRKRFAGSRAGVGAYHDSGLKTNETDRSVTLFS